MKIGFYGKVPESRPICSAVNDDLESEAIEDAVRYAALVAETDSTVAARAAIDRLLDWVSDISWRRP